MEKFTTTPIKRVAKLMLVSWFALSVFNNEVKAQVTNLKGLVILIDFSDAPAIISVNRTKDIYNTIGYTEPTVSLSVRDYWFRQSRGKINLTHDVLGYFRAPKTAAWYKAQPWQEYLTLSKLALDWAVQTYPSYDWNSITLSTDPGEANTFLAVNILTTEWIGGSGGTHWLNWTAPNGKNTGQITALSHGKQIDLFGIIHEHGHSIWGIPDTYDRDGSSHGTASYSVMSGNQNNGQIESFGGPFILKKGWVNVVDIAPNQSYTLTQDGNTVARFKNPSNPKEYFIIEARMKSTLGNEMIPVNRGLLIWHADENVTTGNDKENMTQAEHYEYSIEQADGKFDLEHNTNKHDTGDMFVQGNTFSNTTTPNTKWWNGSTSGLNINTIQFLSNNQISFCNGTCSNTNCTAGTDLTDGEHISRVQFGTIDNSSASTGYSDYTSISTNAARGSNMNITVTNGDPYIQDTILIWCDWNNDKVFDEATELAYSASGTVAPYTGNIAIPVNAVLGNIKMRIRIYDTGNGPFNPTPCGNAGYGEVEDYTLKITAQTTSIDANDLSVSSLNFYPNPNNGEFAIEIGFLDNGSYNLQIVNLLGQVIYHEALNINNTSYNYYKKFNLTDISKGIYIVKLTSNNRGAAVNKKISIE